MIRSKLMLIAAAVALAVGGSVAVASAMTRILEPAHLSQNDKLAADITAADIRPDPAPATDTDTVNLIQLVLGSNWSGDPAYVDSGDESGGSGKDPGNASSGVSGGDASSPSGDSSMGPAPDPGPSESSGTNAKSEDHSGGGAEDADDGDSEDQPEDEPADEPEDD